MLGTIELQYKNNDNSLYNRIVERLNLYEEEDSEHTSKTSWENDDPHSPLRKVTCFSICYNASNQGRIWWTVITVDLRLLLETEGYTPVPASRIHEIDGKINSLFQSFFGFDLNTYLPDMIGKDLLDKRITYLEYMVYIKKVDANPLIKRLERAYFSEKQLDPEYFDRFWIRNATPAFTINRIDDETIRLCMKCKETAIKNMYKKLVIADQGVPNKYLFDKDNAVESLCKQIKKYTKPQVFEELSKQVIEEYI